ncbi:hypothetical protein EYF80_047484 [Liparis tanakae]|uniref:Uncharacterized protein n=1 Tax=Liparis tanakae TaxID=230148 RepID=A0A4Z2FNK3_9TELE|nr:hypothetical protein EYF80_047484 [Liparis tanakae]
MGGSSRLSSGTRSLSYRPSSLWAAGLSNTCRLWRQRSGGAESARRPHDFYFFVGCEPDRDLGVPGETQTNSGSETGECASAPGRRRR